MQDQRSEEHHQIQQKLNANKVQQDQLTNEINLILPFQLEALQKERQRKLQVAV